MKKFVISIIILVFVFPASGAEAILGEYTQQVGQRIPKPRIKNPSERVSIAGREYVTFKWSPHESISGAGGKYYDFRIYKGTKMVQASLIYKQRLPGNKYSLDIPSNLFSEGQIYACSLRLVYKTVGKSSRSIQIFTVENKK